MFSQTSEYAIRALSLLVRHPRQEFVLVSTLAAKAELPHYYLSKILQNLARMEVLDSRRGRQGGFRLARDPDEITLHEIVHAIENLGQTCRCLLGQAECSDERACPLHEFWVGQTEKYMDTLRSTTLGDLVRFETKVRPKSRGRSKS